MTRQPIVPELVARLDENLREAFEERAAIMEFDGGLPRDHAECLALLDVLSRHPLALTGVTLLQVSRGKATQYVMTGDSEIPISIGMAVLGTTDLISIVSEFGGIAAISRVE